MQSPDVSQSTFVDDDWLLGMPKVELHVHLEGTISPETLLELADRNGIHLGVSKVDDVQTLYQYKDFPHFIEMFGLCSACIRTADDLGLIVARHGEEMARQNIRYAELHFNPEPHLRWKGIPILDQLGAINDARARIYADHGIELRWIADGVRDAVPGPRSATDTVQMMVDAGPDSGIVALGLGGNEQSGPVPLFTDAFDRARAEGFHVVAHAGEGCGPESIQDAVTLLSAERIGHGVRAVEDPRVIELLVERGIPLEVCPTSNVRTGVVRSFEDHPLPLLVEAGVECSVNTDDPPMFGCDLVGELQITSRLLGLDRSGTLELMRRTVGQSFADEATKRRLIGELDTYARDAMRITRE